MESFRPLRVLLATLAFVAAIAVLLFAVQDWWTQVKYVHRGWSVTTAQGWYRLLSAIGETIAAGTLSWIGVRCLTSKPLVRRRSIPGVAR